MTPELTALTCAALLQMGHIALYAVIAQRQVGARYAFSPRDTPRQLTGIAGRTQRAMMNHVEALPLFAIAVMVTHLADRGTGLSAGLAWTYVAARVLYVPAYLFGFAPGRSLIWGLGWLATLGLLLLALL